MHPNVARTIPTEARILYAVSSMGLGHAQRSLPLVRALIGSGVELTVISHGRALEVLRTELADARRVRFHDLPDYPPLQQGRGVAHYLHFLKDFLKLQWVTVGERRFLARLHGDAPYDVVVTDGRFGFLSPAVPTVLLTHQMRFFLPPLFRPFQRLSDAWQRRLLLRFTRVFVPDLPAATASLAGSLAHNEVAAEVAPLYIGPLSTLDGDESAPGNGPPCHASGSPEVVFVMGGFIEAERRRLVAEVHRIVEEKIVSTPPIRMAFLLGGGVWGEDDALPGVEVYPLLVGEARRCLLKNARLWVGRTGLTTLMDLWATRACGVLVPTPGMTEQIHLAEMVREWDHRPEPGRDTELAMPFLDALPGSVYFDGRRLPPPLLAWSTRDSVQAFLEGLGEVVREAAGVDRHPSGWGVTQESPPGGPRVGLAQE